MEDLSYKLDRRRVGSAVIVNNLDKEQSPTRQDVERMSKVLQLIGFDVEIYTDMTGKDMSDLKRKFTDESKHKDANCFLILIISHGTADNFIQCCEGTKSWNIECLVTEVCDIKQLEGKPKLFFIEACRGQESNLTNVMMTKSGSLPQQTGISLPSKQDVFVGFATVPGFVSYTSLAGSPYLQALAKVLEEQHSTMDLSDIHLLVKRQLATTQLAGGNRQGAEERSSLLFKLMFSKYQGSHKGSIKYGNDSVSSKLFSFNNLKPSITTTGTSPNPGPSTTTARPSSIVNIPIVREQISQPQTSNERARSAFFSSMSTLPTSSSLSSSVTMSPSLSAWIASRQSLNNGPGSTSTTTSSYSKPPRSATYNYSTNSAGNWTNNIIPVRTEISRDENKTNGKTLTSQSSFQSAVAAISPQISKHKVEVCSENIEKGLKELLDTVIEVYGGEGKVKLKKKFGSKKVKYSFKYLGPEKAAKLLDESLKSVRELQIKGPVWRFTQNIEVKMIKE